MRGGHAGIFMFISYGMNLLATSAAATYKNTLRWRTVFTGQVRFYLLDTLLNLGVL